MLKSVENTYFFECAVVNLWVVADLPRILTLLECASYSILLSADRV